MVERKRKQADNGVPHNTGRGWALRSPGGDAQSQTGFHKITIKQYTDIVAFRSEK